MDIHSWFPTLIGVAHNPDHKKQAPGIIKRLQELKDHKDTKKLKSFHLYPLHKDKTLEPLNNWIERKVDDYVKFHNWPKKLKPNESWFHWYTEGHHNDFHDHRGTTISLIYYVQADINDARVEFKSPVPSDMKNPYGRTAHDQKVKLQNDHTYTDCYYKPVEGMLLMFRSYVEHRVEMKKPNLKDRIVISWDLD